MYKRAIEANPRHTYALYNYAVLLEDVKQDFDRAEEHFKRAVEASPRDVLALGDYAAFLRTRRSKPKVRGYPVTQVRAGRRLTASRPPVPGGGRPLRPGDEGGPAERNAALQLRHAALRRPGAARAGGAGAQRASSSAMLGKSRTAYLLLLVHSCCNG